jgi:hypothetical protein
MRWRAASMSARVITPPPSPRKRRRARPMTSSAINAPRHARASTRPPPHLKSRLQKRRHAQRTTCTVAPWQRRRPYHCLLHWSWWSAHVCSSPSLPLVVVRRTKHHPRPGACACPFARSSGWHFRPSSSGRPPSSPQQPSATGSSWRHSSSLRPSCGWHAVARLQRSPRQNAATTMADPVGQVWRWLRLRARRAFIVVGAVPDEGAAAFVSALRAGNVLPIPVDARAPEEADVIVLVGRVSTKAAAAAAQLRIRAPHALIVAIDAPHTASYATAPAGAVVDADVVVTGLPPSAAAIDAVLDAVLQHRRREVP